MANIQIWTNKGIKEGMKEGRNEVLKLPSGDKHCSRNSFHFPGAGELRLKKKKNVQSVVHDSGKEGKRRGNVE